jgi:hypothetical protein
VHRSRRLSKGALVALLVTALLAMGFVTAVLVATGDDGQPSAASREPQSGGGASSASTTTETTQTSTTQVADGIALGNQGFELQEAGDYSGAIPLLRAAVIALAGSGRIEEAYASYNLAFSRFAVDHTRCDGVMGLLDRSERIQGHRDAIDELRRQW